MMIRFRILVWSCLLFTATVSCSAATASAQPTSGNAEILWDTWGVPHIFSNNEAIGFRAFGWAQMHSNPKLLPQLIAAARGRGAEFYGADFLVSDRAVRTFGFYTLARSWLDQQPPNLRDDINAFAAGINQFAQEHPEKLDSVAKSILPVTGVDIIAHTTRVLEQFVRGASRCSAAFPDHAIFASNAWAIAPSHSAENHSILLANPHLPWSDEFTFFEAQVSLPGYHLYGATLIGVPVIAIGFNKNHGWTHTVNTIDACDVYELTPQKDGYKYDGQLRHFTIEKQVIKVRQDDGSIKEEPLIVRHSVQGPVIEKQGRFFALRVAGIQSGSMAGAVQEWWEMGRAGNLAQFQAALKRMQMPMFNVIYADREGHIELLFDGLVPARSRGDAKFWRGGVPGDKSDLVWTKMLGYDDLPKAVDPKSGWVQNSNSPPWYTTMPFLDAKKYPPFISAPPDSPAGALSFREQRGIRMITASPKLSFEQVLEDKYSTRSELADRILDDLVQAASKSSNKSAVQAANVLGKWDRKTDTESKGAFLFEKWHEIMEEHSKDIFAQTFDPKRPLETPRGLKDPEAAVNALAAAADEVQKATGRLDVSWGDINRLHRGKFDLPGNGGPDELGIFRVINYRLGKEAHYSAFSGDSFVAVVAFSNPLKARVLLSYGNSSDPESTHFGDQLELSAQKQWRTPWLTKADIEKHLEDRTEIHRTH